MKSAASSPDNRGAFTFIELLVVIAIIGTLASLLLPSLIKAKAAVKATVCKNNLRQIAVALNSYVTDFEHYPAAGFAVPMGNIVTLPYLDETPWFLVLLAHAGQNPNVFYCPANPAVFRRKNYPRQVSPFEGFNPGSYGYNALGTQAFPSVRLDATPRELLVLGLTPSFAASFNVVPKFLPSSAVTMPSDMIAVGDSQSDGTNDFTISPIGLSDNSVAEQAWPGKRHRRGANIVFCDGHVEHARQKKWLERTPEARRRWNRDNEPHAEGWHPREVLWSKYAE